MVHPQCLKEGEIVTDGVCAIRANHRLNTNFAGRYLYLILETFFCENKEKATIDFIVPPVGSGMEVVYRCRLDCAVRSLLTDRMTFRFSPIRCHQG